MIKGYTMKTRIYLLLFIVFCFGCSDFLEEKSGDEVRPASIEDLEQLLLGSGYGITHNMYYCTEIFTDNIVSNGVTYPAHQAAHDKNKWKYIWDEGMFTESGDGHDPTFWQAPYEGILGCNLVLDNLDDMPGTQFLRESLRGEALTLRAWYYLHLVNFFGIAYNQGNPETNLGVPLKLNSTVTGEYFTRNTVEEVYASIERDLLEGNRLLTKYDYKRDYFRMGHLAAKAILSRVYLYMENWDKASVYADSVLMIKADLLDLNSLAWKGISSLKNKKVGSVYTVTNPDEIIWGRELDDGFENKATYIKNPFSVADDLWGMYDKSLHSEYTSGKTEDIRGILYFSWAQDMGVLLPGGGDGEMDFRDGIMKGLADYGGYQGIRTAELYLNRAEAYARKYLADRDEACRKAALADLSELRRHRYNNAFTYDELDITDGQELLDFCLAERRKELCGETNHRWCDLRRLGLTVQHVLVEIGKTEYEKDMTRYALPIPEEILKYNPNLVQNK